jgi:hypothetical protein
VIKTCYNNGQRKGYVLLLINAGVRNSVSERKKYVLLPLFNTNFISTFEINALKINAWKGTRHFNPPEDYRFFQHWFSGVKTP